MYLKKELYELIKTDESILDFIIDNALDSLWYWDLENPKNGWVNARFWTMLGYASKEMSGKSCAWRDVINQDDLKLVTDSLSKYLDNSKQQYDQVIRYVHKDGSTIWMRCRGIVVRDKDGKPFRMLGTHQNITEIKNKDRELGIIKEKAEENESKIREITENISEVIWLTNADNKKIIYVSPA